MLAEHSAKKHSYDMQKKFFSEEFYKKKKIFCAIFNLTNSINGVVDNGRCFSYYSSTDVSCCKFLMVSNCFAKLFFFILFTFFLSDLLSSSHFLPSRFNFLNLLIYLSYHHCLKYIDFLFFFSAIVLANFVRLQ